MWIMKQFIKRIRKKFGLISQRIMWTLMDSGKIRVHLTDGTSLCFFRFCGKTIAKWGGTGTMYKSLKSDVPVLYLQINREAAYTLDCIQMWLYVAEKLGAEYWILCDNYRLAHRVLKVCKFPNSNIRFVRSKNFSIRKQAGYLCSLDALPLTKAQLTPFYHAKENGIERFWKIDADDTMFLAAPEKIATAMEQAARITEEKGKAAASYDMWFSHMSGQHWSFGITYISGKMDFTEIFSKLKDKSWMEEMKKYTDWFNLDWFFTYLRGKKIPLGVFHLDGCMFVHWGDNLRNPYNSWISEFSGEELRYPIMKYIYGKSSFAVKKIQSDSWKICAGTSLEESMEFLWNEICQMRKQPMKILKCLGLTADDFAENKYISF